MDQSAAARLFEVRIPTAEQAKRIETLRGGVRKLFGTLVHECPNSAEMTLAIRRLEECLFWGSSAIMRAPNVEGRATEERIALFAKVAGKTPLDEKTLFELALGLGLSPDELNGKAKPEQALAVS